MKFRERAREKRKWCVCHLVDHPHPWTSLNSFFLSCLFCSSLFKKKSCPCSSASSHFSFLSRFSEGSLMRAIFSPLWTLVRLLIIISENLFSFPAFSVQCAFLSDSRLCQKYPAAVCQRFRVTMLVVFLYPMRDMWEKIFVRRIFERISFRNFYLFLNIFLTWFEIN